MTPDALTGYLYRAIPLSSAMQVRAIAVTADEIVLEAPLAPNINHRGTLFGGSASALAILAAWSLLHLKLEATGVAHRLVIQHQGMSYDAPATGTVTAHAVVAAGMDWSRAVTMLRRRGRTRLWALSELRFEDRIVARMTADFVALARQPLAKS